MRTSASWQVVLGVLLCLAGPACSPKTASPPAPTPPHDATPTSAASLAGRYDREVAGPVDALVRDGWTTGLFVGIVTADGEEVVRGYGRRTDGAGAAAPDEHTVFEIGSVTKVFTSILLADMVVKGIVALDTPAATLLPKGVKLPGRDGKVITLGDLATHTSGLPRLPSNLDDAANPGDPYASYRVEDLYSFLNTCTLQSAPGAVSSYSNLGVGLLGHLLALKNGASYEELLRAGVTSPLGMADTSITLSADQRRRLAQGHDADGTPVPNWNIPTLAGAGAVRSTGRDLLRFVRANLAPDTTPLAAALAKAQEVRPIVREDGSPDQMGLGWAFTGAAYWHNGGTGGYRSFVAVNRLKGWGIVILSNSASDAPDELFRALQAWLDGGAFSLPLPTTVSVDAKTLARYVGVYNLQPGFDLTITVDARGLSAQATGQPRFRLYATSPTSFRLRVVDALITFEADDAGGPAPRLVLHQNGRDVPGKRKSP